MNKGVGSIPPLRPFVASSPTPIMGANPKMSVQLGEEHQNSTGMLLETDQQLKAEMDHLWTDIEILMQDRE